MSVWTRAQFLTAGFAALLASACGANARSSGARAALCEGCAGVLERDPASFGSSAIIAGPDEPGEKLVLRGIVRTPDGAPAPDVVVYAYHTNAEGLYANGSSETEWSRRHGRLRAWVRAGADGAYEFHTIKPAPYPTQTMPAHIHLMVGEPGRTPDYIEAVVFDGEFRVDDAYRRAAERRGGSGIVRLAREGDALLAVRDITLEA